MSFSIREARRHDLPETVEIYLDCTREHVFKEVVWEEIQHAGDTPLLTDVFSWQIDDLLATLERRLDQYPEMPAP